MTPRPPATATLPHAELERHYAIVRDIAKKNTALSLDFDDRSFTLYPATTEFFGLTEQQSAAVQDALDKPIASLLEPLSEVREITMEFHESNNGYTLRRSVLGPDGKPYNTSAHSRFFDPDPTTWREKSPHLWRFSHILTPPPSSGTNPPELSVG